MIARIYRPAKTAMQSGTARTQNWVLEYAPEVPKNIEPLMGWTSSSDMNRQICLRFDSCEEAVAYAERNGIPYHVLEEKKSTRKKAVYSDNFRSDRVMPWTH